MIITVVTPELLAIERDLESPADNSLKKVERKFHSLTEYFSGYHNKNFTTDHFESRWLVYQNQKPDTTGRRKKLHWKKKMFWYGKAIFPNKNWGSEYAQKPFTGKMKEFVVKLHTKRRMINRPVQKLHL